MLEFSHLNFITSDSKEIFDDFSFKFPKSGLVAITGPNGGGKSTLAQLLMGLKNPTSGQILLDGEDITALNLTERAKLGLSYAFQQPVRIKGITVFELIDIALGGGNEPRMVGSYLEMVGLLPERYLGREIDGSLSGGEMKRIEIASVLARQTRISIFDEPEAGIDLWSFNDLKAVFQKLKNDNPDNLIIIISHQEKLLKIADEILVLDTGKIVKHGAPNSILPYLKEGRHEV